MARDSHTRESRPEKGLLTIVAAPPDSDELVVGSLFLHRTDDITPARPLWIDLAVGADVSLHGDRHAIAFVDKDRWYVGDDGGLFATLDRGATWRSLNATLRTMEFYSASPAASDSGAYVGGQQDNGQGYSLDGSTWFQFLLGDGMYTHADPRSPTGFFASAQRGDLYYLEPGAPPRSVFVTGTGHPEPWRFEGANYSPSLYRLRNISLAGTATVETVPKPEQASETPATDVLGHAVVSPVCSESLYVVKVGWLEGRKLFKTTTGGASWTNISGNLPNVPVHWIALDPLNPDVVCVGTNVGAFVATDGGVEGEQWQRLGTGLPNVPVMQLKVSATRTLVAATYGRGIWTLALPALTPWTPKAPVVSDVSLSESVLWPHDHRMVDVSVPHDQK